MYQVSPTVDNVDHVSEAFTTTGTIDRDPAYEAWLDDRARNEADALDAELDLMAQQAEREAAAGFGDLTAEKHAELMAFYPEHTRWIPVLGSNPANADKPFSAELRRGTDAGPDVARLGNFRSAEAAFRSLVMLAINVELAERHGDAAALAAVAGLITYARPAAAPAVA
jgi:hypothetical protein